MYKTNMQIPDVGAGCGKLSRNSTSRASYPHPFLILRHVRSAPPALFRGDLRNRIVRHRLRTESRPKPPGQYASCAYGAGRVPDLFRKLTCPLSGHSKSLWILYSFRVTSSVTYKKGRDSQPLPFLYGSDA